MNKFHEWINTLLIGAVVVLVLVGGNQSRLLAGGTTNYDALDVTDGYMVDGVTVINGSGAFVGSITTTALATFEAGQLSSATTATSSASSATIPAADWTCGGSYMVSLPVGSVSLTLPATSTLSAKIPATGDWCRFAIVNSTTTASQNVTVVQGTGWTLASTTNPIIGPNKVGVLDVVRKANGDFVANLVKGGYAGSE